jgi:hypothetical protein
MYLSIALVSLLGFFTVIHAVPIQHNEVYNGEMASETLRKRDYYDRGRDPRYDDSRYDMRPNPNYFRPANRGYQVAANNRVYPPQYYTQSQYTNGYSDAEMQNYIAAAAIAAANAVATPNSATPATPGTAAPAAAAAGTNNYDAMLTTSDPQVLFGQSVAANAQPASSPFMFTGDNTIATPVQANVGPPPQA